MTNIGEVVQIIERMRLPAGGMPLRSDKATVVALIRGIATHCAIHGLPELRQFNFTPDVYELFIECANLYKREICIEMPYWTLYERKYRLIDADVKLARDIVEANLGRSIRIVSDRRNYNHVYNTIMIGVRRTEIRRQPGEDPVAVEYYDISRQAWEILRGYSTALPRATAPAGRGATPSGPGGPDIHIADIDVAPNASAERMDAADVPCRCIIC